MILGLVSMLADGVFGREPSRFSMHLVYANLGFEGELISRTYTERQDCPFQDVLPETGSSFYSLISKPRSAGLFASGHAGPVHGDGQRH